MKVGILSMQRICNYGSYLQAYGLKKIIESLGHEVVFVDYYIEKPLISSASGYFKYIANYLKKVAIKSFSHSRILCSILPRDYRMSAYFYNSFRSKYWPLLGLSKNKNYHTRVDVLVIGSDEVFNCLQSNPDVGYSTELFGDRSNANKIITYAASFGNVTYEELQRAGLIDQISDFVSQYNAISVRDKNTYSIMKKMVPNSKIQENFDPVLMYDFSNRKREQVKLKDYIIVYAYRGRLSEDEIKTIQAFAHDENKKIVSIGGYHSFADEYIETSPFHVLDYFENADYVITDTFHGTIFSIISHTKFGVLVRVGHGKVYGNSEKLNDLLIKLNSESRIINSVDQLSIVLKKDFDFCLTDGIIKRERERTLQFLRTNL